MPKYVSPQHLTALAKQGLKEVIGAKSTLVAVTTRKLIGSAGRVVIEAKINDVSINPIEVERVLKAITTLEDTVSNDGLAFPYEINTYVNDKVALDRKYSARYGNPNGKKRFRAMVKVGKRIRNPEDDIELVNEPALTEGEFMPCEGIRVTENGIQILTESGALANPGVKRQLNAMAKRLGAKVSNPDHPAFYGIGYSDGQRFSSNSAPKDIVARIKRDIQDTYSSVSERKKALQAYRAGYAVAKRDTKRKRKYDMEQDEWLNHHLGSKSR